MGTSRRLSKCESLQPCLLILYYILNPVTFKLLTQNKVVSLPLSTPVSFFFRGVYDYELTLRTDLYTTKHTQWFYFRVRNMKAGVTYRFTIINLMKSSSLYSQGMRPLLYSERAAEEKGVGWQRTGANIKYYRNCSQVGGIWIPKDLCEHTLTVVFITKFIHNPSKFCSSLYDFSF